MKMRTLWSPVTVPDPSKTASTTPGVIAPKTTDVVPGAKTNVATEALRDRLFNPALAMGDPAVTASVKHADLSPIDDLLYLRGDNLAALAKVLKARGPEIRTHTQLKKELSRAFEALGENPTLEQVKALEVSFKGRELSPGIKTRLMTEYMNVSSWSDVRRVYEDAIAANPTFKQWEIPREFYIVSLNKLKEPVLSLKEAQSYVRDLTGLPAGTQVSLATIKPKLDRLNGEVLAGMGKAFLVLSQKNELTVEDQQLISAELGGVAPKDGNWKRAAVGISTNYYEAGFQVDQEYYPGINTVYGQYLQGDVARAEATAKLVKYACLQEGGAESKDYWCLATQLELALIMDDPTEAVRFLPIVLKSADADWKIDSTVTKMSELAANRKAKGQDTTALDYVVKLFGSLLPTKEEKEKKLPGRLPVPTVDIANYTMELAGLLKATPSASIHEAPDATTQKLLAATLSLKGLKSKFVGGNVTFGGQVPDRPVSRTSVALARELIKELRLDTVDDPEVMLKRVDGWLQKQLNLEDPLTGARNKEDLHNDFHAVDDNFSKNRLEFAQSYRSGDSRTDLMLSLLLGHDDCRGTGVGLPFLAATWARDRQNSLLRTAYEAVGKGDLQTYEALLPRVEAFKRFDVRKSDSGVWAAIKTEGADDANPEKGIYREVILPDGRRQSNPTGVPYLLENHTMPVVFHFDAKGTAEKVELYDPWYQEKYPWARFELNPEEVHDPDGFKAGVMGFTDEQGRDIPVRIKLSKYSGAPLKPTNDEAGQMRFAGLDIAPASLKHFRIYGAQLARVSTMIASLNLSNPNHQGIKDQLTKALDTLGERAVERVRKDLDAKFKDSNDPLVALGKTNLVLDEGKKKLNRADLARVVGSPISEAKFRAIQAAPVGTLLVAAQPGVGLTGPDVRQKGETAIPPMLVALYLADFRRGEAVDEVLGSIADGQDDEAVNDLVRLLEIARVGSGLVWNERATSTTTREMLPTGATEKVQARIDFAPFGALTKDVAALDEYELKPAANWLSSQLANLGDASPAAAFLEKVLTTQVDGAAADAHNVGWRASKEADFANPNNPFLGWGPKRVRIDDDLKAMTREQLAQRLGVDPANISDAKLAAVKASANGADVTHHLYKPYTDMLGDQADGGARMAGQNALALMTLSRHLLSQPQLKTVGDLKQTIERLRSGADRGGIEDLSKVKHMVFQAAQLVRGERGVESTVPTMAASGKTVTTPARTDFVSATPAQRATDELAVKAAASILAEALAEGAGSAAH